MIASYREEEIGGLWFAIQTDDCGNIRQTVGQYQSRETLVADMAFGKVR